MEDIAAPNAFDEAAKGVDAVAHTASPFHVRGLLSDVLDGELTCPVVWKYGT